MRRRPPRDRDSGVVLINVLVIIALASAVVIIMISSQESSLDRVTRMADAAAAEQVALGAEASVLDALRRDLDTGPDADHFSEPWAGVIQAETTLSTGRFSVSVEDVQAKYDINLLASGGIGPVDLMARLLDRLDQPPELAPKLAALVRRVGPVRSLQDLGAFGVPQGTLDALAPYVTALPEPGVVNLNTAPPLLLEVMLKNRSAALRLVSIRERTGQITRDDIASSGAVRPENSGWTSNLFDARVLAEVGVAQVRFESRILRTSGLDAKSVRVLTRRLLTEAVPTD